MVTTNLTLEDSIKTLNNIRALRPNWNEDGADAFTPELINRVEDIVKKLKIQPYIFPTQNDSIQLEYEFDKDYLEFEIFENTMIKVFNYHFNNEENTTVRSEYITEEELFIIVDDYFKHKENSRKK